jgi:uncharacterized protein (DUF1697 family)
MTVISLLRGINLGKRKVAMDELRAVYETLGFQSVRSFIQSGNVLFKTPCKDLKKVTSAIETAIDRKFGFHSEVALRTLPELEQAIANNPFVAQAKAAPNKVLVVFLAEDPGPKARETVMRIDTAPVELHATGRELYIYYPNGQATAKLPWSQLDKLLPGRGTGRNWNTVLKLRDLAKEIDTL